MKGYTWTVKKHYAVKKVDGVETQAIIANTHENLEEIIAMLRFIEKGVEII